MSNVWVFLLWGQVSGFVVGIYFGHKMGYAKLWNQLNKQPRKSLLDLL